MKRREFLGNSLALSGCLAFLGVPKFLLRPRQTIIKEIVVDRVSYVYKGMPTRDGGLFDYVFRFKNQKCFECGQDGEYWLIFHDPIKETRHLVMKSEHLIHRLVKDLKDGVPCTVCGSEMKWKLHKNYRLILGKGWA